MPRSNDERRTRLVYEDGVDLVDDRKMIPSPVWSALAELPCLILEIVAKIIETEFVVGAIGYVGRVRFVTRTWPEEILYDLERALLIDHCIVGLGYLGRDVCRIVHE